ncbi:MAG: GAF domain-containing protein [Acidobacteria bacterium]|nr:GAF domain-containing protein [Acidobacteriota bacterium]
MSVGSRILLVTSNPTLPTELQRTWPEHTAIQFESLIPNSAGWAVLCHGDQLAEVIILDQASFSHQDLEFNEENLVLKTRELSAQSEVIWLGDGQGSLKTQFLQSGAFAVLSPPHDFEDLIHYAHQAIKLHQFKQDAQEKRILNTLLDRATRILSGHQPDEVLESILQAIQSIGFDRVRLYTFSDDKQYLIGQKHIGMDDQFLHLYRRIDDDLCINILYKNNQPQIFKRADGYPIVFEPDDGNLSEWGCVLMVYQGNKIGKISVDNKLSRRPIQKKALEYVQGFAELAAAAFQTICLVTDVKTRVENLSRFLQVSTTVISSLEMEKTLTATCQSAVQLLGVDHSGFVVRAPDGTTARVMAEYPGQNAIGKEIRIAGIQLEEDLFQQGKVINVPDVTQAKELRSVRNLLLSLGVQSLLVVPVVIRGRVFGSLSLDSTNRKRTFTDHEIDLCTVFAKQVAIAIENARLYEEATQQAKESTRLRANAERHRQMLDALNQKLFSIQAIKELPRLQKETVRLAAELLGCSAGALFVNHLHSRELELVAEYQLGTHVLQTRLSHQEGLVGEVARLRKTASTSNYAEWPEREAIFQSFDFQSAMAIPLMRAGEVEEILFLGDQMRKRDFDPIEQEILERFAARAAIEMDTSKLLSNEQRMLSYSTLFLNLSTFILTSQQLDQILHAILTVITAGYGLGFNRAALFLKDGNHLVGKMGIGQLTREENREVWDNLSHPPDAFRAYLDQLPTEFAQTSVFEIIDGLQLPIDLSSDDCFSQLISEKIPYAHLVQKEELVHLPKTFIQHLNPSVEAIIVPLKAQGKILGLIYADNEFIADPITEVTRELLLTLADTAALAIHRTLLFQETEEARQQFQDSLVAAIEVNTAQDPVDVLGDVVERILFAERASRVDLFLIDQATKAAHLLVTVGEDRDDDSFDELIRPEGISIQVFEAGVPQIIPEIEKEPPGRLNLNLLGSTSKAALCLPFSLPERRIGVVWILYDYPRSFPEYEVTALQHYMNLAALIYQFKRRSRRQEALRQVSEALAKVQNLAETRQQIIEGVEGIFEASSAVLWSYNSEQQAFDPQTSVVAGISDELWNKLQKFPPRPEGMTATILQRGWVGISVVDEHQYPSLSPDIQQLLKEVQAVSFQGVALKVGEEIFGVLYINSDSVQSFSEEAQQIARSFASQAALALKKARLIEELEKIKQLAQRIATAMTQNIDSTLEAIAAGIQDTLRCDAVTLYPYKEDAVGSRTGRISHTPKFIGVRNPDKCARPSEVTPESTLSRMLHELPAIYPVPDVEQDPLFYQRFAQEEKILSCVGIRLEVNHRIVGILFVNYRTRHQFTDQEVENITWLANLAAIAISNAQLFYEIEQEAKILQALYGTTEPTRGSLLNRTFEEIVNQACELTNIEQGIIYADIRLVEGEKTILKAFFPESELSEPARRNAVIDLRDPKIGVTGRAVKEKKIQIVPDVSDDPDYRESHPETRSELTIPIFHADTVVGVINVESNQAHYFKLEHLSILIILADVAAFAIEKAAMTEQLIKAAMKEEIIKEKARHNQILSLTFGGIAHEVKGHSIAIKDNVEDLVERFREGESVSQQEILEILDLTERHASSMTHIVNDFQWFVHSHRDTTDEFTETVDLEDLIKSAIKETKDRLKIEDPNPLQVKTKTETSIILSCRANLLRRAIISLLVNAVEAIQSISKELKDGDVWVELGKNQNSTHCVISVFDRGPGFSPSEDLFEPFFTTKGSRGLGLGLAICKFIIEAHRGSIEAAKNELGGTVFMVTLPVQPFSTLNQN